VGASAHGRVGLLMHGHVGSLVCRCVVVLVRCHFGASSSWCVVVWEHVSVLVHRHIGELTCGHTGALTVEGGDMVGERIFDSSRSHGTQRPER
jgi:hypothetical protein